MTPARNRVLYGGRSSSKSWDAAGFAIFLAQQMKLKFLCTRQFQNRIEDSVYSLLKIQIERFGLRSKFRILDNKIICTTTGSEFVFYGLWRQIDEVKSIESIDIHWSEEAHLLTEAQWKVLEPTIRKQGSQHWLIFNPRLATDFVYKRFVTNPPPRTVKRLINYDENPFLSQTMRDVIEAAKAEDEDEFAHIYLGQPKDDDDDAIIKRSWIMAAIDAHKALGFEASGRKRIGYDIADSGSDKCANVYAYGSVVSWADLWKAGEDELLKSCTRVWKAAQERRASVTYDSIGVGASAGAKFGELNSTVVDGRIQYQKFNAGAAVFKPDAEYQTGTKNKDMFLNLKAQTWWLVADRFRNTYNAIRKGEKFSDDEIISISSDLPYLDQLIDELSTPKRDYDNNGKVKVESKKDLAKREVASPNLADAFVMIFAPGLEPMQISQDALKQLARMGHTR
jgi:phage terminase large subunit